MTKVNTKTETNKVKEDLINGFTKLLYVAPESLAKIETINFFKKPKDINL